MHSVHYNLSGYHCTVLMFVLGEMLDCGQLATCVENFFHFVFLFKSFATSAEDLNYERSCLWQELERYAWVET